MKQAQITRAYTRGKNYPRLGRGKKFWTEGPVSHPSTSWLRLNRGEKMAPAKQTLSNANSKWIKREAGANNSWRYAGTNLPAVEARKKFWTDQNFVRVQPRVVQVVHELCEPASRFIHLLLAFDSVYFFNIYGENFPNIVWHLPEYCKECVRMSLNLA